MRKNWHNLFESVFQRCRDKISLSTRDKLWHSWWDLSTKIFTLKNANLWLWVREHNLRKTSENPIAEFTSNFNFSIIENRIAEDVNEN